VTSSSISVYSSGRERRSPLRISFYVGSSHCTKSAKWARGESIPRTRITLALLSRLFNWRDALIVVQPKTLIRWHRAGFRLLWHWKSKPGRPPIPTALRRLIREMSRDNSLWGEERIANELLVKLGIRVSPRTVRKYMRRKPGRGPRGDQRWRTFLRNHAVAIVACDFCVAVTARFRVLYIFVIIEHASRRLLHWNVTSNPTAAWTLQQLREAIASDHPYRFLVHDRDSIYTQALDTSIANLRLRVLKTPYRSPKANSLCERLRASVCITQLAARWEGVIV
jgi:putative transposase